MNNIFYRVLLAIYAFILAIASLAGIALALGLIPFETVAIFINDVLLDRTYNIILFTVCFIFFLLSVIFLLSGVGGKRDKKFVSKYTNIGEIRISLDTLENIALAASRKFSGIRETKASVTRAENGVAVMMKIMVFPEINIPALSEDLQIKVKNAVEETSGVQVNGIQVLVENLTGSIRTRVE